MAGYRRLCSIEKHQGTAPEPAFLCALLIGVGSYFLHAYIILMLMVYIMTGTKHALDFRTFFASILGLMVVGIIASIMVWMNWIEWTIVPFFRKEDLIVMIPSLILITLLIIVTIVDKRRHAR